MGDGRCARHRYKIAWEGFVRLHVLILCAAALVPAGSPARADIVSVSPSATAPNLGKVAQDATTDFTINPSTGVVTQSGTAKRISTASVTVPVITVTCNSTPVNCNGGNRVATVRIAAGGTTGTGSATITSFNITTPTGTGISVGTFTPGPAPSFTITFPNGGGAATFNLGMTIRAPATGNTTGLTTMPFTVTMNR